MDFGVLFNRAARITWEHKALWLFGFIVALFGGGYSASSNFRGFNMSRGEFPVNPATGAPDFERMFPFLPPGFAPERLAGGDIRGFLAAISTFLVILFCVILFLGLVFALVQWIGRGALIGLVNEVESNGSAPTAGEGFNFGVHHFLRLFLIALLLGLPTLLLIAAGLLVFGAGLFSFITTAMVEGGEAINPVGLLSGLGCLLPLICVAVVIGWVLGLLRNLAVRAAVIENLGVLDSIGRGWSLMKSHIGEVILLWIVFAIIGAVFSFVVGLPGIAIGLPLFFGLQSGQVSGALMGMSVLLSCGYGIVVAALSSLLVVFVSSGWTLAYREFAGMSVTSAPAEA